MCKGSTEYRFDHWENERPSTHSFIVPDSDQSYKAVLHRKRGVFSRTTLFFHTSTVTIAMSVPTIIAILRLVIVNIRIARIAKIATLLIDYTTVQLHGKSFN